MLNYRTPSSNITHTPRARWTRGHVARKTSAYAERQSDRHTICCHGSQLLIFVSLDHFHLIIHVI